MGDQLKDGLGQAWALVATFVPKLVGFLIILAIGWLVAKAIATGMGLAMRRLGFDQLVEKTGVSQLAARSGVHVGTIIVKLVYYFVLLIALQLACGVFGQGNPVSTLLNDVIAFLPRIVVAIVLVVVAAAIGRVVRDLIGSAMGNRPAAPLLGTAASVSILALGVIAALNQVEVATTVTVPILIAVLATAGGVIVVGVGGGLVRPMQARWDGWINRMQQQLTATAPEPRRETAPGAPTGRPDAPHQQAMPVGVPAGAAGPSAQQPTGSAQPPASDTPTPPVGFDRPQPPER